MAGRLDSLLGNLFGGVRRRVRPTETAGHPGTAIYGGYVVENEKDGALTDREKYRQFSEALANTSIVAASVRYFLNLTARATWTFVPAEHPEGERYAELAEEMLTKDPSTSWARIVRRAAMYRFYGFSVQEWTARRREDGYMTFADIAPRAQITIERWDTEIDGSVIGVVQRNPQNQEETYLPRTKLIYLVDDTLNDSPQGLGLFRHIINPVRRLLRYEQLEGFGFETDLRGVPVGRAPYSELRQMVNDGTITQDEAKQALAAIEKFVEKHVKKPDLGLLIDSAVFQTTDEAQRPSSVPKFSMELLDGTQTSLPDMALAINRLNREIARIIGTEALLLGDGQLGSQALARDKTQQFSLTVDSTLDELAEGFEDDLLTPLWQLNGWPEDAKPSMKPESSAYRDVEQVTSALADLARSGAMLDPDDPAVNDVRALLGLSPVDTLTRDEDASLNGNQAPEEGSPDNPDEDMPTRPQEDGR